MFVRRGLLVDPLPALFSGVTEEIVASLLGSLSGRRAERLCSQWD